MIFDKSWEAIHYLLTGDIADGEPPLGYVIPLNENVETLAEPRAIMSVILTPEQVREAAAGIAPIDAAAFRELFDFHAMVEDELYPLSPDEDEKELYEYIWAHFSTLKTFYQEAKQAGCYVVFEIC
ncbi:YfbM family protein [Listeria ilorinensis]|uniref:YfbM family protein n=1 Tax=Listeria ilorinensis TaxID=2867439 RepID=UPI001EF54CFA|nr:YfbM family protein [Listeria ilorinensis]